MKVITSDFTPISLQYWTDCLNGATPAELFPLAVQTSRGALQQDKGGMDA